jgi:hypothetical protein
VPALLTIILSVCVAGAAERGFDKLVERIEARFQVQRTHIPMLWLGRLVIRAAQPEGVKDLKLAVFEDVDLWRSDDELGQVVRGELDGSWRPLVSVKSRLRRERTCIFARSRGRDVEILVAVAEPDEAIVLQLKVDARAFLQMLEDPEHIGRSVRPKGDGESAHRDQCSWDAFR